MTFDFIVKGDGGGGSARTNEQKELSDLRQRVKTLENEKTRLLGALRKITNCNHGNVVKYIQYVDGIALDALVEFE